ncbi:hypothetical protein T492DRAFT_97368 [Pavlovales sp. CCMP2436]|nr:hypothetical protein T492DRAFT_97368 [Pavlovales sp. CCMP2436]
MYMCACHHYRTAPAADPCAPAVVVVVVVVVAILFFNFIFVNNIDILLGGRGARRTSARLRGEPDLNRRHARWLPLPAHRAPGPACRPGGRGRWGCNGCRGAARVRVHSVRCAALQAAVLGHACRRADGEKDDRRHLDYRLWRARAGLPPCLLHGYGTMYSFNYDLFNRKTGSSGGQRIQCVEELSP